MIKSFRFLLALCALGLGAVTASAMNNDDVLKMLKADLDEETIVLAINAAQPADFDISANALVALKEKGVSPKIIQAIVKKEGAASAEATAPTAAAPVARITSKNIPDAEMLPAIITPAAGKEYYTRYTLKHEEGVRPTTNYWRGELAPINSKVQLVSLGENTFTLKFVDSGAVLKVENVEKYSKRSIDQIAKELLAETPTPIEKYGPEMAEAIRTGTLRLGMTKTQVLMTRGYPPGHETSSLDLPMWKYWSSRFIVLSLAFDSGILHAGRGLY